MVVMFVIADIIMVLDLVDFLMNYLSLGKKEGRYIINIGSDLSKTKDYITYKVTVNK